MINVIHCVGQLNTGGAETLLLNIYRNINRQKYHFDFLVFNPNPGYYDDELKKMGSIIDYLPSLKSSGLIKYLNDLIIYFKKKKPDIVHSHMDWQGGFIAFAAHRAGIKKIIVHSHANQQMYNTNFIYYFFIYFNKILISKYATDCIACSDLAGKSLFKHYEIILNGIDLTKFFYPNRKVIKELKKEIDVKSTDIVLGAVGSLSINKNHSFLVDIMVDLIKYNSNYKLIIVGEGNEKDNLIAKVHEFNLEKHVFFTGRRIEIAEWMDVFDIFLFPSKKEGLGIVAIEAQASGLPCIVSTAIPKEINITNKIHFLPLEKELWIKEINSINRVKQKNRNDLMVSSDFNILNTCKQYEKLYDL